MWVMGCCRGQVGNMWDRSGVKYLTYFWPENGNCIIFDESNAGLDEIYGTVEEALENHEAVLIHSVDGCSRACFCAAVYFILKYRWCVVGDVAAGRWHVCLVCARDAIVAVIVVHNTVSRCARQLSRPLVVSCHDGSVLRAIDVVAAKAMQHRILLRCLPVASH